MTVADLIARLTDLVASGSIAPGDPVARSFGVWGDDGETYFKKVMFVDERKLPRVEAEADFDSEGIDHLCYHRAATGPIARVVVLD